MKDRVLILRELDGGATTRAAKLGLRTVLADIPSQVEFDKALIVEPGTKVPWDLVEYGMHFIDRWDVAAPLWRYGKLAEDIGDDRDRSRTRDVSIDLRVLLHSYELLFVNGNETGRAFLETWEKERADGADVRLAFNRAFFIVKPRLCALPISWMAEVAHRSKQDIRLLSSKHNGKLPLVKVEVSPGRFITCKQGDEEKTISYYREITSRRGGRRG